MDGLRRQNTPPRIKSSMSIREHLRSIHRHNVHTLRRTPLAELSGSLGDLGTLLPLMIAMAMNGSIDLPSTLVFSGITNILTGVVFGVPLPVSLELQLTNEH